MKSSLIFLVIQYTIVSSLNPAIYDTGEEYSIPFEFVDARVDVRNKRETDVAEGTIPKVEVTGNVSIQNVVDLTSNGSVQNARIGKDGHDLVKTTLPVDGFSTGEEYEGAFTVDPSKPMTDFDGTSVNVTRTTEDTHTYYNSSFSPESTEAWTNYWVDLKNDSITHELISNSHRRTATIDISFEFPFYGHIITNVTLSTGGFLYMGDHLHPWLAATQYVAPLLADFDTTTSTDATVKYRDNGTALTVQWENVRLHNMTDLGAFTFQATLYKSGDIAFVYKDIPVNLLDVNDDKHPVKVGLSDAYILDRTIFFVRRKIIYMYHKIDFKENYSISNKTVLYFKALPTCNGFKSCSTCIEGKSSIKFECYWCPAAHRCSDGMDRKRQDWLIQGCDSKFVDSSSEECLAFEEGLQNATVTIAGITEAQLTTAPAPTTERPGLKNATVVPGSFPSSAAPAPTTEKPDFAPEKSFVSPSHEMHRHEPSEEEASQLSGGSVFAIILIVGLLVSGVLWIIYAYYNPHSPSGQFLIKYRPNAISLRRGEPQYTAAIHM